jgi:hypothetical protein
MKRIEAAVHPQTYAELLKVAESQDRSMGWVVARAVSEYIYRCRQPIEPEPRRPWSDPESTPLADLEVLAKKIRADAAKDRDFDDPIGQPKMERMTVSLWDNHDQALAVVSMEADERGTFPVTNWGPPVARWRVEMVKYA